MYAYNVNLLSGNFKTTNALKFTQNNITPSEIVDGMKAYIPSDTALYDVSLDEGYVRTVYHNSDKLIPNIIEGRYFDKDELGAAELLAVIGNERLSETFVENGQRKIKLFGNDYSVIGVMGYTDNYSMNFFIFVNSRAYSINEKNVVFMLDSTNRHSVDKTAEELSRRYEISIIQEKINNIDRAFHYSPINRILILILALLGIGFVGYLVFLQYEDFRSSIKILYYLGKSGKEIRSFNRGIYIMSGMLGMILSLSLWSLAFFSITRIHELLKASSVYLFILVLLLVYYIIEEIALGTIWIVWRLKYEGMH